MNKFKKRVDNIDTNLTGQVVYNYAHNRTGQAQDSTNKKCQKNKLVTGRNVCVTVITQRFDVKNNGDNDHSNESNEMGPNVSSFRMNPKYRIETGSKIAQSMVKSCVQKLRDWRACHFDKLPAFLKDNNYLHFGHRPELGNFAACFNSIFRIHTETGNIWTHLIGFIAMVIVTIVFYVKPLCDDCHTDIAASDKLIFLTFFIGAILCLACPIVCIIVYHLPCQVCIDVVDSLFKLVHVLLYDIFICFFGMKYCLLF
jgi:hypothetical protein